MYVYLFVYEEKNLKYMNIYDVTFMFIITIEAGDNANDNELSTHFVFVFFYVYVREETNELLTF